MKDSACYSLDVTYHIVYKNLAASYVVMYQPPIVKNSHHSYFTSKYCNGTIYLWVLNVNNFKFFSENHEFNTRDHFLYGGKPTLSLFFKINNHNFINVQKAEVVILYIKLKFTIKEIFPFWFCNFINPSQYVKHI